MRLISIAVLLLVVATQAEAQEFPTFDCAGAFAPDSSDDRLIETFGSDAVLYGEIRGDEGTVPSASVLNPEDPSRRLSILWQVEPMRERPLLLMIGGGSEWRVEGLTVGMSIDEVEALNGKAFRMGGFNDIDRGRVAGWNGGRLSDTLGACRIDVQFSYPQLGTPLSLADPLESEGPYPSSHPAFRALGARISSITITYPTE